MSISLEVSSGVFDHEVDPPCSFEGMVQPRPLRGAGVAVYGGHVKTYVYIDGFNFYYGAVKDSP
jgi:hypothetical protein